MLSYVPGRSVLVLILTLTFCVATPCVVAGVLPAVDEAFCTLPLLGETASQVAFVETLHCNGRTPGLLTAIVCAGGAAPPSGEVKESTAGLT